MSKSSLPGCIMRYPDCGACHNELAHDGESFYCDRCKLDYGRGDEDEPATFRDEEDEPCGAPSPRPYRTKTMEPAGRTREHRELWSFTEYPCNLPAGHNTDDYESGHYWDTNAEHLEGPLPHE